MDDSKKTTLVPSSPMTRRQAIGTALMGTGSVAAYMALGGCKTAPETAASTLESPASIPGTLDVKWTGPAGIGDYAQANGNTHMTVNAAHALRDGGYDLTQEVKPEDNYDLVIVGGGISGLCSAFEYRKTRPDDRILIIDNNAIFGGEAKQNEIEVDGYRLQAPQGSNMCVWPATAAENLNFFWHKAWRELGMPMGNEPDAPQWLDAPNMSLPKNHYSAMMVVRDRWPQAQFFPDPAAPGKMKIAMSPWQKDYQDMPWPEEAKQQMVKVDNFFPTLPAGEKDLDHWMDSMTYKDYLTKVVGVTHQEVFDYLSPQIAAYGTGMGCETVSALAARDFLGPGTSTEAELQAVLDRRKVEATRFEPISFPGGNATIARYFVKRMIPDAIEGAYNLKDITYGKVNFDKLDKPGQKLRIRVAATALVVRHDGDPAQAKSATVTYVDNNTGEKHRVRGKSIIMATGAWINKFMIQDMPDELREAMDQFNHAPMLIINVAVRNWNFAEKLGAPALRWHEGMGWFTNIRAPMSVDGQAMPAEPGKPAILTFYVPFCNLIDKETLKMPVRAQCITARTQLFDMSYADIEQKIRKQLADSLSPYGFDADKDIAQVIINRWGHAYVVPEVGFFHGKDGKPSPREVVKTGYGRVRFGHSELSGVQVWHHACAEGERAARQVLELV